MKKTLIVILVFATTGSLLAQNIEEGKKMFYYQRYYTAKKIFQDIIKSKPDEAEAYFWHAITLSELNDSVSVNKLFDNIPLSLRDNPYIKITKGYWALNKKDSNTAKDLFTQAIGNERKKDPNIQYTVALANIESNNGDNFYAIELLNEALSRNKKNVEYYIAMGEAYRKLQDGGGAFKAYSEAVDINKSSPIAYFKIGKIYQSQDNKEVFTDYYSKAENADPTFAPTYYQLYLYYFYHDLKMASSYLDKYIANTDKTIENDYLRLDLLYVSQKYKDAITLGNQIVSAELNKTQSRIYKLLAYCYDNEKDQNNSYIQLKKYFDTEKDTSRYAAQDYALMGKNIESINQPDNAKQWFEKAFNKETNALKKLDYAVTLSDIFKKQKEYAPQAVWLERIYNLKPNTTNLDIYNWGIAEFYAKQYKKADSVFEIYQTKYPQQTFGYYWRARSNAAIDTAMSIGIAVPHYEKLIEVAEKDVTNPANKKWLLQAYGYVAAFKANNDKDYSLALSYYDKILNLEPANADAIRYKGILQKILQKQIKTDKQEGATTVQKEEKKNGILK